MELGVVAHPLDVGGLLAFCPILHAAAKLRDRFLWMCTAGYVAAIATEFVLTEASSAWAWAFAAEAFLLSMGGTAHALRLRPRVFPSHLPVEHVTEQPAYQAALRNRRQREEARALAQRDPALSRDLRIGRPDLPRQFDDGGLVDVNHVPAAVLVHNLGLRPADADRIVAVRDQIGGFGNSEELTAYANIPPAAVDAIRDRLVFLRP